MGCKFLSNLYLNSSGLRKFYWQSCSFWTERSPRNFIKHYCITFKHSQKIAKICRWYGYSLTLWMYLLWWLIVHIHFDNENMVSSLDYKTVACIRGTNVEIASLSFWTVQKICNTQFGELTTFGFNKIIQQVFDWHCHQNVIVVQASYKRMQMLHFWGH